MLTVVAEESDDRDDRSGADRAGSSSSLIDEIVREGAPRVLAKALAAEVDAYIARFLTERDAGGRRMVVRNGSHQPREVLTSAEAVEVSAPRVNDRRVDPGGRPLPCPSQAPRNPSMELRDYASPVHRTCWRTGGRDKQDSPDPPLETLVRAVGGVWLVCKSPLGH